MLTIFQSRPLIDSSSADWIFDTFEWVLQNFDSDEFFHRSRLVQPTNDFFPGNVDSVHAKAENIFQHTVRHAGLSHWPFRLQSPEQFKNIPAVPLHFAAVVRDSKHNTLPALICEHALHLTYNPQQTLKPEDLSSGFAHWIAQHLVAQAQQLPPKGMDYLAEGTEVLAVVMGFGVLLANSAYTFRGGCGSCYNGQANRQATLSEDEVVFALALYCRLKEIPDGHATSFLKKHLKSSYKRARKQIEKQPEALKTLMKYRRDSSLCHL
jgi:hypothetical protein